VLVHLIVTLGDERLPEGYDSPLTLGDLLIQDRVDRVEEIYVVNKSAKPVELQELELKIYSDWESMIDGPVTVEPTGHIKSKPDISTTSVFRAARKREVKVRMNGTVHELLLTERRIPVSDLRQNEK
jgi:hypothetical protein